MKRTFPGWGTLLLLSAMVVPGVCRAEETPAEAMPPLQVGPVLVNPSLTLKETFTDNAFYTDGNTTSDLITTLAPAIKLRLPLRMHELTLGADAEFNLYLDNSSLNTSPFQIYALGDFSIGDRVKVKVGDTYQHYEESPLESPNGTQDTYTANAAALTAKYLFADVAQAQFDYTHVNLDYPDSNYRTRAEDRLSLYLYYRVLPATSAFLEYDFKNVGYDTTGKFDNVVHTGQVGATWEITEYSKGTAKVGFLTKLYDDGSLEDYSTWTASVDLQHRVTDAVSVRLLGKREVNEGKETGVRYYTTTGFFADCTYRFLERLSAVVEGSYAVDAFSDARPGSTAAREDDTVHVGVGAKYSFNSWLDVVLGYGYSNRDSNRAGLDAAITTLTLKVTAYR
jgi:hypothetical protein